MTRSLITPTTKSQRAIFERLDDATRERITDRANELYDGTRTNSECWRLAFGEWIVPPPLAEGIGRVLDGSA